MKLRFGRRKGSIPNVFRFKLPRLKLYQQIIACFVLMILIPLVGISIIVSNINQKALKKEIGKFTTHTAQAIYKDLETEMSWQQDQARLVGNYFMDALAQNGNIGVAAQKVFALSPAYEAIGVYDTQGQVLQSVYQNFSHLSPDLRLPLTLKTLPENVAGSQALRFQVLSLNPDDPQTSQYYLRSVLRLPSAVDPARPAFYVLQKRFDYLHELIRDNVKSLHSAVLIIDPEGMILAGPEAALGGRQKSISPEDLAFFKSIPVGVTREFQTMGLPTPVDLLDGEVFKKEEEGQPLKKVIVKMPDINWGIIIESPYMLRQTYIQRAREQSTLLIAGCLLLISLLSLFYVLGINRNFRQLIKGIKAMAEGNYGRRIRLITKSWTPDEIVYLTTEFNKMARRMSDAWQSSQTLTEQLVQRNQEEAFMKELVQSLHGRLTWDNLVERVSQSVSQFLDGAAVLIVLDREARSHAETPHLVFACAAYPHLSDETVQKVWLAIRQRQREALNNPLTEAFSEPFPCLENARIYVQPITLDEVVPWGSLCILSPEPVKSAATISPEQQHLLSVVSQQVAVACHQIRQWETIELANRKLAKLDELKSNLIDTVSHELRTPLTSIKGYTSRLIRYDHSLDPETKLKSLKTIKQQADRLGRMVEDLLVIPDLEKDSIRVFLDQVPLVPVIEQSVSLIKAKDDRVIQVSYEPAVLQCSVLADPDRLEQVLVNLLDNAVKYSALSETAQQAEVWLHVGQETIISESAVGETAMILIQVANPSPPIPEAELRQLFDKFKRLDDQLTRTTRGTGLGLFITKGLVEKMGGEITLDYQTSWNPSTVGLTQLPEVEGPSQKENMGWFIARFTLQFHHAPAMEADRTFQVESV